MKAIVFLGTGPYAQTTYVLNGKESPPTPYFPIALCRLVPKIDRVYVFVTRKVRVESLSAFREAWTGAGLTQQLVDVSIPDGATRDELWKIFDGLAGALDEGDDVVFDITHSFRMLPSLVLVAASYLMVWKRIRVRGIYYGNFEARTPYSRPAQPTDRTPVFDMSPFVSLMTLSPAADTFLRTGDAGRLVERLPSSGDTDKDKNLSRRITEISDGLRLIRPLTVTASASGLAGAVDEVLPAVRASTPPFADILQRISAEYGQFAVGREDGRPDNAHQLDAMLLMMDWYVKKNLPIQAVALAREYVVTRTCLALGLDETLTRARRDAEDVLNGKAEGEIRAAWESVPVCRLVKQIWFRPARDSVRASGLSVFRNDLVHSAGKVDVARVAETARRYVDETQRLAKAWPLEKPARSSRT